MRLSGSRLARNNSRAELSAKHTPLGSLRFHAVLHMHAAHLTAQGVHDRADLRNKSAHVPRLVSPLRFGQHSGYGSRTRRRGIMPRKIGRETTGSRTMIIYSGCTRTESKRIRYCGNVEVREQGGRSVQYVAGSWGGQCKDLNCSKVLSPRNRLLSSSLESTGDNARIHQAHSWDTPQLPRNFRACSRSSPRDLCVLGLKPTYQANVEYSSHLQ